MEITQIGAGGLLGSLVDRASGGASTGGPERESRSGQNVERQPTNRAAGQRRGSALGILRQEIRQALSSYFRIRVTGTIPAYQPPAEAATPGDVADEAIRGARQLADRSPLEAREELMRLRARFDESVSNTRQIVGDDDDDVDAVVSRISDDLDELDDDAARNVVSSASVLSAESRLRQRSTIRIRTQEGDVVRLDLRRVENFSAQDVMISDGNASLTSTQVEMSSRSRMMLRVNGDLNEAEFAAIQSVFNQAEAIADEFFGGDLGAAFNLASGIEFDSDQLANVKMRFRERQVTNVSYAAIRTTVPQAPASTPRTPAAASDPGIANVARPEPSVTEPETTVPLPTAEPVAVENPDAPNIDDNALGGFFDLLSNFLNAVNDGFEFGGDSASFRFFYSQSFNLEILKTVLQVRAPEDAGDAANTAATLIDAVSDEGESD